jgi:hypothetical protein
MNIHDTLMAAADRIETVGWWNGGEQGGGTCAANAIGYVGRSGKVPELVAAHRHLADHIGVGSWGIVRTITDWNDAQPDGATVVATMRAAAATSLTVEQAKEQTPADAEAVGVGAHV